MILACISISIISLYNIVSVLPCMSGGKSGHLIFESVFLYSSLTWLVLTVRIKNKYTYGTLCLELIILKVKIVLINYTACGSFNGLLLLV